MVCFFKQNNFLVGISLDGPEELHNRYRRDKSGKPSFKQVMAGIELLQKHKVEYNILTSVHRGNVESPLKVYEFLVHEAGGKFIQFIPIVNRMKNNRKSGMNDVSIHSISGDEYGSFLIKVFDLWVKRDVGVIFVQIFDEALGAWSGHETSLCIFRKYCGDALVLEHNGDLYSCDHFVNPDHLLGNIMNHSLPSLVFSTKQNLFGKNKYENLPEMCNQCEYNFIRLGGCPKNRFSVTPKGDERLNVLCNGYKSFFGHIDKPMRIMVDLLRNQEPPAKIMNLSW